MTSQTCEGSASASTNATSRHGRRGADPILVASKSYLLAGAMAAAVIFVIELPIVQVSIWRLCWALSPWPTFPWPYELDYREYLSQPIQWSMELPWALLTVILYTLLAAMIHGIGFLLAFTAHRYWGWPRYWSTVRPKLQLNQTCATSAKRTWWIAPLFLLVSTLMEQIAFGLECASYPMIARDLPLTLAPFIAALVAAFLVCSRVLGRTVADRVGEDELRCFRCGYLLRGLAQPRCPECGYDNPATRPSPYGLRFRLIPKWAHSRTFGVIVGVALMLASAWIPAVLAQCPSAVVDRLPKSLRPDWRILTPQTDSFPIRLDLVCVIHKDGARAVVRFTKTGPYRHSYTAQWWPDSSDLGQSPNTTATGTIRNGGGPDMPIGPWTFSYSMGSDGMIWLTRPDQSYAVEAFKLEDFESPRPPAMQGS